jgi:hypothetical protein
MGYITCNINAIHLLEKNKDKIIWEILSLNRSEDGIKLLEKNQNKIDWTIFIRK